MLNEQQDIRWEQRFSNYRKALKKLGKAIEIIQNDKNKNDEDFDKESWNAIEELQKEGLIQQFEYTHELAWNTMKDYSEYQGNTEVKGLRDATREAFKMGLIIFPEIWMSMIKHRNQTSHTYNEETVEEILDEIITNYYAVFLAFETKMEEIRTAQQSDLFSNQL
jgi:nucleotidyltransferase substrate binding protein (TIGR01987 family)